MSSIRSLIRSDRTLLLPGVHDAIGARMAEDAGFEAYTIGGSAVSTTQLALPDIGLQSFGEYRDAISRITQGSTLPVMVDGENGFGDAKAVTRTIRSFELIGVSGIALEDLTFPPVLGQAPTVIPETDMIVKLEAALAARTNPDTMIIGRTDAAGVVNLDEGIRRAALYESIGVDAVLLTGLADIDAMKRVREAISVPIIAIIIEEGPWVTATPDELTALGYEVALYPASLMLAAISGYDRALKRLAAGDLKLPSDSVGYAGVGRHVRPGDWAEIDARATAAHTTGVRA